MASVRRAQETQQLAQLDKFIEMCKNTQKQLEQLETAQKTRTDAVDGQLSSLFNNAPVLCLLKEG